MFGAWFSAEFYKGVLIVHVLYNTVFSVWFFHRREKFPIPIRRPFLVLSEVVFSAAFGFCWILWEAFPQSTPSCGTGILLTFFTAETRVFLLWSWDFLTQLSLKYEAHLDGLPLVKVQPSEIKTSIPLWLEVFLLEHLNLITFNKVILFSVFTWSWISLVFVFGFVMQRNRSTPLFQLGFQDDQLCLPYIQLEVGLAIIVVVVVPGIVACFLLRDVFTLEDNFGLVNDLRGGIVVVCFIVVGCSCGVIPGISDFFFQTKSYHFVVGFAFDIAINWVMAFRVVIWTYILEKDPRFVVHLRQLNYSWKSVTKNPRPEATNELHSTSVASVASDSLRSCLVPESQTEISSTVPTEKRTRHRRSR